MTDDASHQGGLRALHDFLTELGVERDDLPADEVSAAAMAADVVFARGDRYDLDGLAVAAGVDGAEVAAVFEALGVRVEPGQAVFSERDLELLGLLAAGDEDTFRPDENLEILHVVCTSLARIAEAAVASHVQGPERRVDSYLDNARINVRSAELGLALGTGLSAVFRHHLRQATEGQRRTQSTEQRELVNLTVGFLDLVGFTSLSAELGLEELVRLIKDFEHRAHDEAHAHRTRVVKLIGDEVMFVSEQPSDAADFVAALADRIDDLEVVWRGGLCSGALVNVHGDYFGPVVNMAARLAQIAVPGEVLLDGFTAGSVPAEPAGRRQLKGFEDPVAVFALDLDS